ncbi:MAG: hypothetical protein IPK80_09960 [Nannocystis sp.]|nr:hypothetical protein [Nannocystis sp.]
MHVNPSNETRKARPLTLFLALVALTTSAILGVMIPQEASAYTCNSGICACGSEDLGPSGGPKLPPGQHESDCDDLVAYCQSIEGSFTCTDQCADLESCCGGRCG